MPHHIAVIMDGNRRFAKEFGLTTAEGHMKGKDKLEEVLDWCMELDIKVLTVYAFSTENLHREPDEVESLMQMFEENFYRLGDDERVHKYGIKVSALGQRDLLPERVLKAIDYAEGKTRDYSNYYYNIALAYGSRQEIIQAIKQIAQKVKEGELEVEDINERTFSNFLLWQLAYAELYFTDVYWPGFRKIDFLRAVRSFQFRQRRFGT